MTAYVADPSANDLASPGVGRRWRNLRFDSFLRRVERKVELADSAEYETVGVRWYGLGAFVRSRLNGAEIARKQQWVVRSGDVVYNKLFAWKGAFALADATVDGRLVSDKFPTYELDCAVMDPDYLRFYFRTSRLAHQALLLSKGAAAVSKLTLNPRQFWDLTIPVPPTLQGQTAIAAKLREIEVRSGELRKVAERLRVRARTLTSSAVTDVLGELVIDGQLGDVLAEKPRNGWSPRCDGSPDGVPVLTLGAVTGFAYNPEVKTTSEPTTPDAHYWLRPGDLLITRGNTPELVGHAAIYDGDPAPCIYPDLMMRVRVDRGRTTTRFVHHWLQTRAVRDYVQSVARGTSPTMKKISQGDVLGMPFPSSVAFDAQEALVDRLDMILARIPDLLRLADAEAAHASGLLKASVDRAFGGDW